MKNIESKNKKYKYIIRPKIEKYIDKAKEIISISLSVQISILPVLIYNLNTFNPYFFISNFILSLVIGPIVMIGFLFIIVVLVNIKIAKLFTIFVQIGIQILELISKLGNIPYAKNYIPTPSLFLVLTYYFLIIAICLGYEIYSAQKPNMTQIRVKNLIAIIKMKLRKNKSKVKVVTVIFIICILIFRIIPKDLEIHFVDVGQGDSCFIVTPKNKTILIDGGGSSFSDFNVGKSTLVPYVLDRGFTKIDIAIISHFDSDHVGRNTFTYGRIKSKKSIYIKTN